MVKINTFDIDGVIYLGEYNGIYPGAGDVIITGRSYEETDETLAMLDRKGIRNTVFFNPLRFDQKTRESSGRHKARVILSLRELGLEHGVHFEDDEVQIAEIKKLIPEVRIVHVVSDIVTKENVRHK
jgi:hypothetical protein